MNLLPLEGSDDGPADVYTRVSEKIEEVLKGRSRDGQLAADLLREAQSSMGSTCVAGMCACSGGLLHAASPAPSTPPRHSQREHTHTLGTPASRSARARDSHMHL